MNDTKPGSEMSPPETKRFIEYSMYAMHPDGSWYWIGITSAANAASAAAQAQGVNNKRSIKVVRIDRTETRSTFVYLAGSES